MYYLSKREYRKDRLIVLGLGLIIGISIGIYIGFLWAAATIENVIRITVTEVPHQIGPIPF